jgi:hypothetical protein
MKSKLPPLLLLVGTLIVAPRILPASVTADFAGGNGIAAPDKYQGIIGGGWSGPWSQPSGISGSVVSSVPLKSGGNYLSAALTAANPYVAYITRGWDKGSVSYTAPITICWRFRFDSSLTNFAATTDQIGFIEGDGAAATFQINAFGMAQGTALARTWAFYNGTQNNAAWNASRYVNTGIPLVQGTVYDFSVTLDPLTRTWIGTVTDGTTSYTSPTLGFRTASASANGMVQFGLREDTGSDNLRFSLDAIMIAAEPGTGPYPKEISAWTNETKAAQRASGQQMLSSLIAALNRGEKSISIPKGHYRFPRKGTSVDPQLQLNLLNYSGVTIDFQESTFWFESPVPGFDLAAGNNTIRNLFVDWDPLPFVQGRVTAIDAVNNAFHVRLDQGYEGARTGLPNGISEGRGFFFDPRTKEFVTGQAGCAIYFSWDRKTSQGDYIVGYSGFYGTPISSGGFKPGDRVALLVRWGIGLQTWGGREGCAIENVTYYASPSLVYVTAGGHSPTMRNCSIRLRPGTNRLMSGNADGFNFSNTSKGPLMENCRVEGAIGDDFVNVHGHLARVIWQESPTTLIVTRMNYRGDFTQPVTVEFFDRATMSSYGKRLATGKLLSGWKVEKNKCRADLQHAWHSGDAASLVEGNTIFVHRITLDMPVEIQDDMILACEAFSGTGAIIRNCTFRGSSAVGIRMQAPYPTIENNVIENTGGAGITLYGQPGFWGEGPFVHHARIMGNVIKNTGLFSANGYHRVGIALDWWSPSSEISIQDNTFINPGASAIFAKGVDGLFIENNRVSGYGNLPHWTSRNGVDGEGYAIEVRSSTAVSLRFNTFEAPGPHARGEEYLGPASE